MFGWRGGSLPGVDHSDVERRPPPLPVDLQFPNFIPSKRYTSLSSQRSRDIVRALCKLKNHDLLTESHLSPLNIAMVSFTNIVNVLPPDLQILHHNELQDALELLHTSNEVAYKIILGVKDGPKQAPAGRTRLQAAWAFFEGLEKLSPYWDSSTDHYYEVDDTSHPDYELRSQPDLSINMEASPSDINVKLDAKDVPPNPKKTVYKGRRIGNGSMCPSHALPDTVHGLVTLLHSAFGTVTQLGDGLLSLKFGPLHLPLYPHPRSSIGLRSQVETYARPGTLRGAGVIRGPLITISTRDETRFHAAEGETSRSTWNPNVEALDATRELQSLLWLAQGRARCADRGQKKAVEQFWTMQRWGGGKGGVMPHEEPDFIARYEEMREKDKAEEEEKRKETEEKKKVEKERALDSDVEALMAGGGAGGLAARAVRPRSMPPKMTAAMRGHVRQRTGDSRLCKIRIESEIKWKKMTTGLIAENERWSRKILYEDIGKPVQKGDNKGWDEVWLLSGVNHHVRLMKLRVHEKYLEWMETGVVKDGGGAGNRQVSGEEGVLFISKGKWHDLFDDKERCEALTELWTVLSYLLRDQPHSCVAQTPQQRPSVGLMVGTPATGLQGDKN